LRLAAAAAAILLVTSSALAQEPEFDAAMHGDQVLWFVLFDELEYASSGNGRALAWDLEGWVGGDFTRVWIKSEGHKPSEAGTGEFEVQALYSKLVAPFWELQAGVRYDRDVTGSQSRVHAVVGLQGLAPYWFHVEPMLFVSQDGDVSARLTATYDLLFSQRLILQPAFEANLAAQEVDAWGVGSGLVDMEFGLRLRYEFRREIAPYVGVNWFQRFGATADLARAHGETAADTAFLFGLRAWF
jgi:copper resistance protein B